MASKDSIYVAFSGLTAAVVIVLLVYSYKQQQNGLHSNFRPHNITGTGYVLSLHYNDQMTGSCVNLLSLQCWATQSNLLVVEPFIVHTWLGATLQISGTKAIEPNSVKLSDVFDIDVWQQYAKKKGYEPLVDWEEFLTRASRDLIIVSQPPSQKCGIEKLRNDVSPLINKFNFTIVREVCFNFQESVLTSQLYIKTVFGEYSPHEVTVIFDRWGGIHPNNHNGFRTVISDSQCSRSTKDMFATRHSKAISSDAQRYINTYLNGSRSYTAVMIRFEYLFLNHKLWSESQEKQSAAIDGCLKSVVSEISKLKKKAKQHSLSDTLLTMDYGKKGSFRFTRVKLSNSSWMDGKIKGLFSDFYGAKALSFSQWDESFEAIAHKRSPAYIAQMQKELAARAQCLVLAGSGGASSFQQQAKFLYQRYHSGSAKCIAQACR